MRKPAIATRDQQRCECSLNSATADYNLDRLQMLRPKLNSFNSRSYNVLLFLEKHTLLLKIPVVDSEKSPQGF